jgi:hypothetical protein
MKTKRISALDGRVTFEIMQPTFASDELRQAARDEIAEIYGDELLLWQRNVAELLAVTVSLETDEDEPELDSLRQVWEMSRNGANLNDVCVFWKEDVSHAVYNAWKDAYDDSAQLFASPPEGKPGHKLTEEERADPN